MPYNGGWAPGMDIWLPAGAPRLVGSALEAQLGAWVEKFTRLFVQSIYKWVQAPLSLHVGNLDLERERALQLPVVETTEWTR